MMNEMMSSPKKGAVFSQHANEAQTPRLLTPSNCFTQNLTLSTEVMVTKKELKKKKCKGKGEEQERKDSKNSERKGFKKEELCGKRERQMMRW